MKILFVLPNIAVGGVEHVRLALIEYLSARGIECRLALRRRRGELLKRVGKQVIVDELAPDGLYQFVPSLARLIWRERPTHVVTAFSDIGVLAWLSLRLAGSRAKWVHTVDDASPIYDLGAGPIEQIRVWMHRCAAGFVHRRADAVVAVSEALRAEIVSEYALNPQKVTVLYNPVVPDENLRWQRKPVDRDAEPYHIVAVGRLAPQKGFDVLVNAMARVQGLWQLSIWGEGMDRPKLARLIAELGLQDRVHLPGYTLDPFRVMRDAALFVMPSRHEGFGNVLVEALACQCQIVAADCPHGPREILEDGRLGELVAVGDVDALAGAIGRAMGAQRHVSAESMLERARDFSVSNSGKRWEVLLHRLTTE